LFTIVEQRKYIEYLKIIVSYYISHR